MMLRERVVGDVTVFELKGKVTLGESSTLLKTRVEQFLRAGGRKLVINMRRVQYIDSSGNGEFVRAYTNIAHQGGKLVFAEVNKRIIDLWTMTKLLTVYETFDDELLALSSFDAKMQTSVCPVCRLHAAFSMNAAATHTCANCSSTFTVRSTNAGDHTVWVATTISVPSYDGESVWLQCDSPSLISVRGRLDLFSVESLEAAWLAIPRPRRVLVDLSTHCQSVTKKGIQGLAALCAPERDGGRTSVWIADGPSNEFIPAESPFFKDHASALQSLPIDRTAGPIVVSVRDRPLRRS